MVPEPVLGRPETPVLSVCIANYNGEALLRDCIDSVLAQGDTHDIEIIVHDDASTDGSLELLRDSYPRVKVLASERNVGFCTSNNRMVEVARGKFVLLLNNDAALMPGAVSTLLSAANAADSPGILTLPQYDWETGALVDRGCLLDPFYNPVPNLDEKRQDVAYSIGACLWIPRDLWQQLGGLPEWMGSIGEDMFLCCAARLRGLAVRCAGGSGYRHRQGASFGGNRVHSGRLSTTYRRRALSERNKTACLLICTPGLLAWPLLALHLVLLYAEGAVLSVSRWDWRLWREVYLPVLGDIAKMRSAWKARRRDIQSQRRATSGSWWSCFTWIPRKLSLLRRHGLPEIR